MYYRLPTERRKGAFDATQIDDWLGDILGHLGCSPPAGDYWSGHSLRKGAATGSFSIDVAILRICHMGGWKVRAATYVDYIDPTCPPSPAAHRFFGWLRPA